MILTRTEIETIISSVRVAVLAVDGKEELLVRDACVAHFAAKCLSEEDVARFMRNKIYVRFVWSEACRA